MKRVIGFLVGMVLGVNAVTLALYFFPFAHEGRTAALLGRAEKADEVFTARVLGDASAATHGGAFPFKPFPEGIPSLDDPNLASAFALIIKIRDAEDRVIGFGTELEVALPESRLLFGRVMTDTYWTIVIPGRGTLFLHETEDNWNLVKDVYLPMLTSGRDWSGEWINVNTIGPRDDWHGVVVGGTGEFAGKTGRFLEVGTLRSATRDGALGGILELRLFFN
ncbi:MAG: hypothetical protein ACREQJ_13435 [Candidatus Binatia bacterium]